MSLAVYGSYYAFDCIGPLAPLFSQQLHFSNSDIGLLQAVYSFPNIVMVLIGGIVIDRMGTKKSTMMFAILCFIGVVITALTPLLPVMVLGRLVFGIGGESLAIATTAANARWFRGQELSLSFAIKGMIERLGSLTAQVSPTWAASAYTNWQRPLLIAVAFAGFCIVGAILYWILEAHAERRYELGTGGHGHSASFRDIFRFSTSYWLIVAICVTFYAGIFPFQTFAQKFLIEARHETPRTASLLVGMLPFFSMIGMPIFGHLVDRVGNRSLFLMFGSVLLMPVYLMLAYTNVPVVVPMAMMGVAFAMVPAVMWPCVAYVVDPLRLGTAFGLMDAFQQTGLVVFNLLIGWSNDHWLATGANSAGYRPGMWMFSTIGFLAMLFAVLLRRVETGPRAHGLETIRTGGTVASS